ncbi:hypothetical protein BS50DRAFT_553325 [Corynespora cassiicola Philippines]|uniref:MYND-type domain-containing protein n=1 Tax=Corynespora cassiicola Philippines TaxID=1448308 RepID=A0A2T2NPH9_CORCC|nr:hypothetical protein BS50DRAFT_553325 [Corynespora cassiicola Philippines]
MESFLNPPLCANILRLEDGNAEQCQKTAGNACAACRLVQYCSKECQKEHWKEHKTACKSNLMRSKYQPAWIREDRTPYFIENNEPFVSFGQKRFLWGNMPALDIIKMKDNEGLEDLGRDMKILFAASGDCRNLVKSIVNLPENYSGQCTVVLNDKDFAVVARNAILLLAAIQFGPDESTPTMIHLWYSASLPSIMMEKLVEEVLPLIEDVCNKIRGTPANSFHAKTFEFPNGSVRLILQTEQWLKLASYFKVPDGLDLEAANKLRTDTILNHRRADHLDRALYTWPPGQRASCMKFRTEGVLQPFGCSISQFDTPNPTFFQDPGSWPMTDSADPLNGWLSKEYTPHASVASADVYGSLFFFLRDVLGQFCKRVRDGKFAFQLYNTDARDLSSLLPAAMKFDRIEIANICDRGYIGSPTTFMIFAPLLCSKRQNPKATLILLFLNAVGETENQQSIQHREADMPRRMRRVEQLMGPDPEIMLRIQMGDQTVIHDPEFLHRSFLKDRFGNFEDMFNTYQIAEQMNENAAIFGLQMKGRHTIVERWPYRVVRNATKSEFEILRRASTVGWERYVEMERSV